MLLISFDENLSNNTQSYLLIALVGPREKLQQAVRQSDVLCVCGRIDGVYTGVVSGQQMAEILYPS